MSLNDYLLEGIDFKGITVMDAGTGAGRTTLLLAKRLMESGKEGRLLSVDVDPDTFPYVRRKLGESEGLVEFLEADLTDMPQVPSGSFDLVVCTATLCALNDRPLKALRGLVEFHRVLKRDGRLVIAEEYPLPRVTRPEEELQVARWQMYKAVAELVEGRHYTEMYPEELAFSASLVGFKDVEWRRFEGEPLRGDTMEEWSEVMLTMINRIEDKQVRRAFLALAAEIHGRFQEQGGLQPPSYVMKMRKR